MERLLSTALPVAADIYELILVPSTEEDTFYSNEDDMIVLRSVGWECEGDVRNLRDVKEQQSDWSFLSSSTPERQEAFVEGWGRAMFTTFALSSADRLECLMPNDFLFPGVLKLKSAQSSNEFTKAFLQQSRLGKLGRPFPHEAVPELVELTLREVFGAETSSKTRALELLQKPICLDDILDATAQAQAQPIYEEQRTSFRKRVCDHIRQEVQ